LEFQAKRILGEYGIPVPAGSLVTAASDLSKVKLPAVLKAQVPVGGRGKSGGIRLVEKPGEIESVANEMFHMAIKGHPVRGLLAEEKIEVSHEFYLAVLYNKKTNLPMIMASATGGVDIEQAARETPALVFRRDIDLFVGLPKSTTSYLAKRLGVKDAEGFTVIAENLYAILLECDATLVEINPLGETSAGLVAMDAKLVLDEKASFRHREMVERLNAEKDTFENANLTPAEKMARECEITYVPLNGPVAMIADGAGTGMLTLDLIQDNGGMAANFCEMGGLANAEIMEKAIGVVLANPRATVLLITLIGGMTRMDDMAEGIARYVKKHAVSLPVVVRMCGTQEEAGKAILREVGIIPFDNLSQAVQSAVELTKA